MTTTIKTSGIIFITLLTYSLVSCKKIYELPVNNLVVENSISNEASATVALNGVYSYFGVYGTMDALLITDNALRSNLIEASTQRSSYELELMALEIQDNWIYITNTWTDQFKVINAANNFIEQLSTIPEEKFSPGKKAEMLGEAHFMRGYTMLLQMKYFTHFWDVTSEYGPLLRIEPSGLNNNFKSRSSVAEGYDQVIADLTFAIDNGPEFYSVFKASNGLAKAYLVETLLMRGQQADYTQAAQLAGEVINNYGFTLAPTFPAIFTAGYTSPELMFSRKISVSVQEDLTNNVPSVWSLLGKKRNGLTDQYRNFFQQGDTRYDAIIGTTTSTNVQGVVSTYTESWLKHWTVDGDVAMRYMRLSQMYIYQAEALFRSGASVSQVLAPLNALRLRADLPLYVAADIGSEQELSDIIFYELMVEIGVENGAEYLAAIRFKNATGERKLADLNPAYQNDNQLALPIPDAELIFNPNMTQNPL